MLNVRNLSVHYGQHRALDDISVRVSPGEIVVILGANGAGKSSLLRAIGGICEGRSSGAVDIDGAEINNALSHDIVEKGIAMVPEGRGVFAELSVQENLMLGSYPIRARASAEQNLVKIYSLFPRLAERKKQIVRTMSGGEQQMVAIGRAMMSAPSILMLDEPSLGLSPLLCKELFQNLKRVRDTGLGILLVEQNAKQSLAIADRGYLIENSRIIGENTAENLTNDPAVQAAYLGGNKNASPNKAEIAGSPIATKKDRKMAKQFDGNYVGGSWVPTTGTFDVLNPSDNSIWAKVSDSGKAETTAAIEAAHKAFPAWAALPFTERAHYLLKIADILEKRKMEFVEATQHEGGGWFGKGMFEAGYMPEIFRAAAGVAYDAVGEVLPSEHGKVSMAMRRPMGVISVISPWNFPGLLTGRGIAFALSVGNTVVLKPSEETPYCGGLFYAEVFQEAGVPEGVLNVVTCSRDNVSAVGDEMVENPLVKGISFTGSTPVGRQIASKAGGLLKKCCVELGGKDALIICDDADMDRATSAANFGSFMHQGQICMSVEKILVHESIFDEFLAKFKERAAKLTVGDTSTDKTNIIGPLINDKQVARNKAQLEDAIAKGAKVELGGNISGRFVEPTILTGVTSDMLIYRDETFGPIVPVIPFKTDEEAVAMANDTEYGLSSGVISKDEGRALAIAGMLETGMCHVNCSSVNDEPHIPFGGSKNSGQGRHGGRWSTETFTETRWITLERGGRKYPPFF